ncbi:SulP family inorganic anion transporter [Neptunitalea lumnitzerae]|uniref:SLC26A/SulP transporter domain-containing protein n=1 Tax=Neptunitalea lumnitzerae TaxID=2965509 RepID=A0ABQ5MFN0_9FLAO|nr:SulP family inorganic anion transporter [Neptunitalea sp. Y10]GLB48194.1 hypothetical protein Y10_05620 [Neptunitalea sp. Y10]
MSPKEKQIQPFLKSLPQNIFSGFVVSLIALPLGLGLAMASDAPPIAGIITAVVGGIIVSIFGGSNVTITGPGNGLVGVLIVAITTLGLSGTYAAIVVSGVMLMALGFLRLGRISDFFPSSAIQGMLAAIGLIILGKQFHIMLGHKIVRDNNLAYLLEIPHTIYQSFHHTDVSLTYAAIAGVASLGIMIIYPKLRNKYLQMIPAPMWIVLLSIGFSYYCELVLGVHNLIHPDYMIHDIPKVNQIIADIHLPDFSGISGFLFWDSVVSLALIASIESLLSIKAVDKLDPLKRRSNVNKDIKALGLATIASGFLGGLNVVTVIARSSVNVNNGGSNRSANFFHAFFLVVFIVLFSTQLTRIPLPALMAILVFTGYKLASPLNAKEILLIGKEQFIIFLVTLSVTLTVGLISGILMGVLVTLIIHMFIKRNFGFFFRYLFVPNVLMFKEEEDKEDSYFISVKHFCTFLNYYKLKNKLEAIPETADVILDFSMCEFVDHTTMESLNNYQDLFSKKGGNFDITGLDMHNTDSVHPFALRRVLPVAKMLRDPNFTKRQKLLKEIAAQYLLNYYSRKRKEVEFLEHFNYFTTKQVHHICNQLSNIETGIHVFDVEYSEGEFIAKEVIRSTMLHIKPQCNIPTFTLDKEGFIEKVYAFAGFKDIPIEDHTDFSKRFYLKGENELEIQEFFTDDLVHFFESNPYYHIESNGKGILIFKKERLAGVKELKALLDYGKRLKVCIETSSKVYSTENQV